MRRICSGDDGAMKGEVIPGFILDDDGSARTGYYFFFFAMDDRVMYPSCLNEMKSFSVILVIKMAI